MNTIRGAELSDNVDAREVCHLQNNPEPHQNKRKQISEQHNKSVSKIPRIYFEFFLICQRTSANYQVVTIKSYFGVLAVARHPGRGAVPRQIHLSNGVQNRRCQ